MPGQLLAYESAEFAKIEVWVRLGQKQRLYRAWFTSHSGIMGGPWFQIDTSVCLDRKKQTWEWRCFWHKGQRQSTIVKRVLRRAWKLYPDVLKPFELEIMRASLHGHLYEKDPND